MIVQSTIAETIFVNGRNGSDINPGTEERPVRTMKRAAEMANVAKGSGPTTIKMAPGTYALTESLDFNSSRQYTKKERLVIEATVLPDEPRWRPGMMPTILSVEDPRREDNLAGLTATHGMKIGVSHVTIRGLKFLGNPLLRNWHLCVARTGDDLDDLVVTQCVFAGDADVIDINCAVLATGDGFVVDHCIFRNCNAGAVFWDGPQGIIGKGCSMRYCIVDGARISGVWTCQTAEDFEFHHNIVTRSEYFWMRKRIADPRRYRIRDCVVAGNKSYSGYGVEMGPTGLTGPEVSYKEEDIVRQGSVVFAKDKRKRNYLHVVPGTLGSGLGAGLFTE
jgi:hypothetical protein